MTHPPKCRPGNQIPGHRPRHAPDSCDRLFPPDALRVTIRFLERSFVFPLFGPRRGHESRDGHHKDALFVAVAYGNADAARISDLSAEARLRAKAEARLR